MEMHGPCDTMRLLRREEEVASFVPTSICKLREIESRLEQKIWVIMKTDMRRN